MKHCPAHLGELAATNPDWRDVLDKLIEATQAVSAVQAAAGPGRRRLLAALQQDAQRLGSRLIIANVTNAQNVLIGDDSTHDRHQDHYYGPTTPDHL